MLGYVGDLGGIRAGSWRNLTNVIVDLYEFWQHIWWLLMHFDTLWCHHYTVRKTFWWTLTNSGVSTTNFDNKYSRSWYQETTCVGQGYPGFLIADCASGPGSTTRPRSTRWVHRRAWVPYKLVVSDGMFWICINDTCCIWWNVLNMYKIYLLCLMECF